MGSLDSFIPPRQRTLCSEERHALRTVSKNPNRVEMATRVSVVFKLVDMNPENVDCLFTVDKLCNSADEQQPRALHSA